MRRIRSEFCRRWSLLVYTLGLPAAADRRVARRVLRSPAVGRVAGRPAHLLIAPPGDGNIGDQALVEAFVESTTGPVVVVVRSTENFRLPTGDSDRVTVLAMPDLVYGSGSAHAAAITTLTRLVAGSRSLSVIGADIMDGRYSPRGSVRRATIAEIGALAGVDSRIIGFSWNSRPRVCARRALVRASRAGAVALLRDPLSAQRAAGDGVVGVTPTADLVFLAETVAPAPIALPTPYAIVNVSGLIARTADHTGEYLRIVDHFRSVGIHVVLLPHVIKAMTDDLTACRKVAQLVGDQGVTLISTVLTPAQVRGLAAGAELTVTGRMHLAVMSLLGGTPAIALATQGKVEGLMELFGAAEFCVPPVAGFADTVIDLARSIADGASPVRGAIDRALPEVIALAGRNTAGLTDAVPAASPSPVESILPVGSVSSVAGVFETRGA